MSGKWKVPEARPWGEKRDEEGKSRKVKGSVRRRGQKVMESNLGIDFLIHSKDLERIRSY